MESLFDFFQSLLIESELAVEELGYSGLGDIVVSGSEAAGYDHDVIVLPGLSEAMHDNRHIVSDRRDTIDPDSNSIQLTADKARIGIDDLTDQQLVADRNDLSIHKIGEKA